MEVINYRLEIDVCDQFVIKRHRLFIMCCADPRDSHANTHALRESGAIYLESSFGFSYWWEFHSKQCWSSCDRYDQRGAVEVDLGVSKSSF